MANVSNASRGNAGQLNVEQEVLYHTLQAGAASDGNVENDEGMSDFVRDAAGVRIATTG